MGRSQTRIHAMSSLGCGEDLRFSSEEQVDCAEGDETHEGGEQFVVARTVHDSGEF